MNLKYNLLLSFLFLFVSVISFSQIQEGTINIESSPEIKTLIAKKIAYNKENHLVDGYRIQLFYGSESGVRRTKNKFASLFPNTPSYIDYDAPEWKVRVGNYKDRLAADKALSKIILEFGDAIVIEYKIRL